MIDLIAKPAILAALYAGVAELVDASVSKTDEGKPRAGSIPALGI